MRYLKSAILIVVSTVSTEFLMAADGIPSADHISAAIRMAIPVLEKGSAGSARERKCFTCHSQALPVFALAEARQRAFTIDQENFQTQLTHTAEHLKRGLKGYREGRGQGGRVLTAGFALWTLEAGDWKPDETTTAVTHYLLTFQKDDKRWHHGGNRPPSSGSDFTNTYVALRALGVFGTKVQQSETDARFEVVRNWLIETSAKDTEDRVFRLRALRYVNADAASIKSARQELIDDQREDGGWSQTSDLLSDAYATGSVLVALQRSGMAPTDPVIVRGIKRLLDEQLDDGSWHVVTRAKGFQPYFETGFPHGKDQFISTSATAWATIALLLTLPEAETISEAERTTE